MRPLNIAAVVVLLSAPAFPLRAQFGPSPYQTPEGLVRGAAFKDLIEPIPIHDGLETNVWGGDNVKPRDAHNGLEDAKWSYWCTSVVHGPDGKEHMFVCRWLEASPKGHREWPRSQLVRAVADKPTGPFTVVQEIGPGHNAEVYRAKDGTYVVYVIGNSYQARTLEGPWTPVKLQFDHGGRKPVDLSNCTFAPREDGSVLMVSRTGEVWISPDGLKPFVRHTNGSVYPPIKGAFEDPVVWRDAVQYHLIVNDWFGRTAYYLRSRDGMHWVWDDGRAYDQDVVRHPDGHIEGWHKLERPKVRQDAFGRATHFYLAGIDIAKEEDFGGDNHSSKSLALPLTVGRRLAILDAQPIAAGTREIRVAVKAEPGFDPAADIDLDSLRFGAAKAVNFGRGFKVKETSSAGGGDLTLTFAGEEHGLTAEDFAAKLLGRTRKGGVLHGYARLPGVNYLAPILSARKPVLVRRDAANLEASVAVGNLGQIKSAPTPLQVVFQQDRKTLHTATATIPALDPYATATLALSLPGDVLAAGSSNRVDVIVDPAAPQPGLLRFDGFPIP